ncbi:hypothetical protein ACLB2K_032223 [Fragaria x ananassa]
MDPNMMTHLTKLDFDALDISGKNYLSWVLDAGIHLTTNNLGDVIKVGNKAFGQERAKTMIFLCHHLDKSLKDKYLTMKDPLEIWQALADHFAHQKPLFYQEHVVEQNNELLMKNHYSHPIGSHPIPEMNVVSTGGHGNGHGYKHGNTSARFKGDDRQRPNG